MRISINGAIALGSVLAATALLQPYRPIVVRGDSMAPTLESGQIVFARRLETTPRIGDVVVIAKDGGTIIKRVAMLPGDQYEEVKVPHASMWTKLDNAVLRAQTQRYHWPVRTVKIPDGQVFVLGDNAEVSLDSRYFGTIPLDSIRSVL